MRRMINYTLRVGDVVGFRGRAGRVVCVGSEKGVGVSFKELPHTLYFGEDLTYRAGHTEKLEIVREMSFDMHFDAEVRCKEDGGVDFGLKMKKEW